MNKEESQQILVISYSMMACSDKIFTLISLVNVKDKFFPQVEKFLYRRIHNAVLTL